MITTQSDRFNEIIKFVGEPLNSLLFSVDDRIKERAFELRIRVNSPISVTMPEGCRFINRHGKTSLEYSPDLPFCSKSDIEQCFRRLCGYSVHSHQNEISNGYISLAGGHRAGICGTAVIEDDGIISTKDITSLNIRIARQIFGAADNLACYFKYKSEGMLIVGSPGSGKTTLLRDLARQLSSGLCGRYVKTAVIDVRGELAAVSDKIPQNELGPCCDVINCFPTDVGIAMATRYLSPEVIICDEIGTEKEAEAIEGCINAGVAVVASIHAGSKDELLRRRFAAKLVENGAFYRLVFLGDARNPSKIVRVCENGDLFDKNDGNFRLGNFDNSNRDLHLLTNEKPSLRAIFDCKDD